MASMFCFRKRKRGKYVTYELQISISGPYVFPTTNSSGAAYSGEPQCVFRGSSSRYMLLRPKSEKQNQRNWFRCTVHRIIFAPTLSENRNFKTSLTVHFLFLKKNQHNAIQIYMAYIPIQIQCKFRGLQMFHH